MTMIAPRSSMMAKVIRNSFSDTGTRLPSSASTPRAKAISVAVGIAQPATAAGFSRLMNQ
ncbi:hypothetical protein D3C71_1659190 [compost metagenome]